VIEISSSARCDQPTSTVFAILTDPSSYPAWQADVESASLAGDASAQQGARIRQVRKVMSRRAEITCPAARRARKCSSTRCPSYRTRS
jgi:hypothetical protein